MSGFNEAAELTLSIEAGFTDDPHDKGNWTGGQVGVGELKGTNFGISAASYPSVDIKNLTKTDALALYRRDYWDVIHADELPYPFALVAFDAAINCGVGAARRLLQESLNVPADGKIGPITIAAANRAPLAKLIAAFSQRRIMYHVSLPTFARYGNSWVRRTFDTAIAAARSIG